MKSKTLKTACWVIFVSCVYFFYTWSLYTVEIMAPLTENEITQFFLPLTLLAIVHFFLHAKHFNLFRGGNVGSCLLKVIISAAVTALSLFVTVFGTVIFILHHYGR